MQWILVVVLVLAVPISVAVWLIVRAISAHQNIDLLSTRLDLLELELSRLKAKPEPIVEKAAATAPAAEAPAPAPVAPIPVLRTEMPPPLPEPQPPPIKIVPQFPVLPSIPEAAWEATPISEPEESSLPKINWEQFMGVKLFAWVGGLALFLGVAFFIKYSFDNNLVPPQLRVAMGFLAGLGLLIGGVVLSRKNYATLSQTLCATGVVILYAVTFACHSIYQFDFFGPIPTFLLMILITTTAFLIADRLNALVVAILGMLGGFLTPILLSTGQDNPYGLFGYIAVLNVGLLAVALHRRWFFLSALGALGTVLMQVGWAAKFFEFQRYFEGNKIWIPLGVLLGFNALFLAASWWAKVREEIENWFLGATFGLAVVALAFTPWFLSFPPLAQRPWVIFGFVFAVDVGVALLVLIENKIATLQPLTGIGVFGLLGYWTANSLNNNLLTAGLVFYLLFAILHAIFPVILQRRWGVTATTWASQMFPPLALVLVLIPIFQISEISFIVWPFILLVDLLAIGLAVFTYSILSVIVVLLLTLGATGALVFRIPVTSTLTGLPTSFFLIGGFAVFFVGIGVWLTRKLYPEAFTDEPSVDGEKSMPGNLAAELPALSAILPFLLLIMATLRLPITNPTPIFGLALLLVVLLLGVTKLFRLEWMPAVGLLCVASLEGAWHFNHFDPTQPTQALTWYLVFLGVFTVFPFIFLRQFSTRVVALATAAMAAVPQFFFIHRLVAAVYPNTEIMGLLPATFAILPLLGLVVVLKKVPADNPARMTQLAWFGGVGLFFITLIFPIQFDRQWITIGWALEGAALLWLFHRLPQPGLRLAGAGLLIAAFARLALNPAVLDYHTRSATPIFNWYLYAYGLVTVSLFCGARLLAPPRNQIGGVNLPPLLGGLGTVLAFLLLNIEIADYFSEPGSTLTFQFSGSFARDMSYSIGWALFALILLVFGIAKKTAGARYCALGLLSVTVIKLFFHDLANLGPLYRIGALIGVATIAFLASWSYQRFFIALGKEKENES